MSPVASVRNQEKTPVLNLDLAMDRLPEFLISSGGALIGLKSQPISLLAPNPIVQTGQFFFCARPHTPDIAKYTQSNPTRRSAEIVRLMSCFINLASMSFNA